MSRLIQALASLWVAVTLLFLVITVLPGDPVRALFGFRAPEPHVYARIVEEYHLDQPVWRQYLYYLGDLLRGDLGVSLPNANPYGQVAEGTPVLAVVAATAPVSAVLLGVTFVVQVVIGLVAGMIAARRGTVAGPIVYGTAIVLVAVPVAVAAYALRTFPGFEWQLLPYRGLHHGWTSFVLPVLALAALSVGYVVLLTRAEVRAVLAAPFVQAARAKGLTESRVLAVHALRPALVPVVAYLAASIGPSLVGLIIVEGAFELPGLGGTLFASIGDQDRSLTLGLITVVMAAVIVATAIADIVTVWLDPRLQEPAAA